MSSKSPVISVIIPVYNSEKYLDECLSSVINQTFKDIEIICIDDCSTDNSLKILENYAKKDSRIKIISHTKNLGCVASKNEGIKYAKGEYIYPFDSDDIIDITTLEKLYEAMKNNLGDIISCNVKLFGKQNKNFELPEPTVSNFSFQNCIINSSLFKKSDFLQLQGGGYDSNFQHGLEDYDLWLNFVFKNHKRVYRIDDVLYYYRIKPKEESRNQSLDEKYRKYMTYMELKYPEICALKNQQIIREQISVISKQYKKKYIKLFTVIPFLKINFYKNKSKVYLFNFIPILKIYNK